MVSRICKELDRRDIVGGQRRVSIVWSFASERLGFHGRRKPSLVGKDARTTLPDGFLHWRGLPVEGRVPYSLDCGGFARSPLAL